MGAALDLIVKEFGGAVSEQETTQATGAAFAEAVKNDANAVALTFINFGAFTIFLSLRPDQAASTGIILTPNGGTVSLNLRDDFTLAARAWFASSPGGASSLYSLRLVMPFGIGG